MENFLNNLFYPVLVSLITYIVTVVATRKKSSKMKEHYLFNRLDFIKEQNIKINFSLKNKTKEVVFKDILVNQVDCIYKECKDLADKIDDDSSRYKNHDVLLNEVQNSFNSIYKDLYIYYNSSTFYSDEDKRTLNIIMNKFYKWNKERVERMEYFIDRIFSSRFYDSPQEKVCAYYDLILSMTLEQLDNAEKTIDSINGDLKGLVYKGMVIK